MKVEEREKEVSGRIKGEGVRGIKEEIVTALN